MSQSSSNLLIVKLVEWVLGILETTLLSFTRVLFSLVCYLPQSLRGFIVLPFYDVWMNYKFIWDFF